MKLNSNVPEGKITEKWTNHKFNLKLVNPSNKRKYTVIVVGTGLLALLQLHLLLNLVTM